MHPFIHLFGRQIPTYGTFAALGIIVAALYMFLSNRALKPDAGRLPSDDIIHTLVFAAIGALVGAKVLYLIVTLPVYVANWAQISADPQLLINSLMGGFVYYGGFIGGFVAVWLYCRKYAVPLGDMVALFTPAVPLFHVFGRIGCFMGGCCWGIEVPWGVVYHQSIGAPNGVPLLPLQLIEAGSNLVLFVLLAVLARRLARRWMVLPLYILLYGSLRFALEFFRGDKIRGVALLSTSQWISLALIAAVVVLYFARWRRGVKHNAPSVPPSAGLPPPASP